MEVMERPLEDFVRLIESRVPFSYSRWGDGEWQSIFGQCKGHDRDGHRYFAQMSVDLTCVLESRPGYTLGLPREIETLYGENVHVWLGSRKLHDLDWISADLFSDASLAGKIYPLISVLREAPSLAVVGPPHLAKLNKFLNYKEFITVPPRDCYLALKSMLRETYAASEHLPRGSVISISAGMPAKIMVNELHKRFGDKLSILDMGSLWDPYVGVKSRDYMKLMKGHHLNGHINHETL